jgi:hypothetical protein
MFAPFKAPRALNETQVSAQPAPESTWRVRNSPCPTFCAGGGRKGTCQRAPSIPLATGLFYRALPSRELGQRPRPQVGPGTPRNRLSCPQNPGLEPVSADKFASTGLPTPCLRLRWLSRVLVAGGGETRCPRPSTAPACGCDVRCVSLRTAGTPTRPCSASWCRQEPARGTLGLRHYRQGRAATTPDVCSA